METASYVCTKKSLNLISSFTFILNLFLDNSSKRLYQFYLGYGWKRRLSDDTDSYFQVTLQGLAFCNLDYTSTCKTLYEMLHLNLLHAHSSAFSVFNELNWIGGDRFTRCHTDHPGVKGPRRGAFEEATAHECRRLECERLHARKCFGKCRGFIPEANYRLIS